MSVVSEFLSDRRQSVRLDGKASASVDVVSGEPQGSILGPLFILYTYDLSTLLGTRLWAMRMILRSMQLFLDSFRILK